MTEAEIIRTLEWTVEGGPEAFVVTVTGCVGEEYAAARVCIQMGPDSKADGILPFLLQMQRSVTNLGASS
jgi:hypothetical protein